MRFGLKVYDSVVHGVDSGQDLVHIALCHEYSDAEKLAALIPIIGNLIEAASMRDDRVAIAIAGLDYFTKVAHPHD